MYLSEITTRIYQRIDRFALDLGRDLQDAFEMVGKARYEAWVEADLPFGVDTARRLRMIHKAYGHFPAERLRQMPRPWQALYALTRVPEERLESAIEAGEVHPDMTVRDAVEAARELTGVQTRKFSTADLLVGKLVNEPVASMTGAARDLLLAWLHASEPS